MWKCLTLAANNLENFYNWKPHTVPSFVKYSMENRIQIWNRIMYTEISIDVSKRNTEGAENIMSCFYKYQQYNQAFNNHNRQQDPSCKFVYGVIDVISQWIIFWINRIPEKEYNTRSKFLLQKHDKMSICDTKIQTNKYWDCYGWILGEGKSLGQCCSKNVNGADIQLQTTRTEKGNHH